MEYVAHGFAVDEYIAWDLFNGLTDGVGDGDDQSPAVDSGDGVALFADHEAATVVLFLEAMGATGEQATEFGFIDGVKELAADAAVLSFVAGLLVGLFFAIGDGVVLIAFGQF